MNSKTLLNEYAWRTKWNDCQRCPLGRHARNHVLGRGKVPARILVVGSYPGDAEDRTGYVMHGHLGRLLWRMVRDSGGDPDDIFITNLVACRPVDLVDGQLSARMVAVEEMNACRPRLEELLELVSPRMIVFVSALAESQFAGTVPDEIDYISLASMPEILQRGGVKSDEYTSTITELAEFLEEVG